MKLADQFDKTNKLLKDMAKMQKDMERMQAEMAEMQEKVLRRHEQLPRIPFSVHHGGKSA